MKEKLRLIRITRNDSSYVVDAYASLKVLGLKLLNRRQKFVKYERTDNWFYYDKDRAVGAKKKEILDSWLSDHNKFVMNRKNLPNHLIV